MDARRLVSPASPQPAHGRALAGLAAAVSVTAWASAFVAIRGIGSDIGPGALTLGRLSIGVVLLGALLLRAGWVAPGRREWAALIGCGLSWFAVYNISLNAAERTIDAGSASMLVGVGPVLVAILAGRFLGEGIPRWLIAGALVSLAGVVMIGLADPGAGAGRKDPAGVLLALAAGVCYAAGVVFQKVAVRRLPALQVTWTACAVGAVLCTPFAGQLRGDLTAAPLGSTLAMIYLGCVPTALAFTTWAYALARTTAGRLGVTTYLSRPVTILISLLLLGEAPGPLQLVGGGICLLGAALSRLR
ncbi:MAG TPA: EamA family transporter [Candidatus Acidoferrum sp.]|nr:EamA family transporter [Candidatus Acidoferrum sp.]